MPTEVPKPEPAALNALAAASFPPSAATGSVPKAAPEVVGPTPATAVPAAVAKLGKAATKAGLPATTPPELTIRAINPAGTTSCLFLFRNLPTGGKIFF